MAVRLGAVMWAGIALLVCLGPVRAAAQTPQGVVSMLSGHAIVARAALPQPSPLNFKDEVFARDRISTAERSIVRVLLGGKALVTVRELSTLTITEEPARSTVDLASGKIAVGVLHQRMQPGETIEIRTPNVTAAVRGTVLVVELVPASTDSPSSPTAATTSVHVLHGAVDVYPVDDPTAAPIRVETLHTYSRSGNGPGMLHPLSPEAAARLFGDLKPEQVSHPPHEFIETLALREHERARVHGLALAAHLTGHSLGHLATAVQTTIQHESPLTHPPVIPDIHTHLAPHHLPEGHGSEVMGCASGGHRAHHAAHCIPLPVP